MNINITPGQIVTTAFRPTDLERTLGVSRSTIWRWSQPAPKGTNGLIPSRYHAKLLAFATQAGVPLTAEDLVLGRDIPVAA